MENERDRIREEDILGADPCGSFFAERLVHGKKRDSAWKIGHGKEGKCEQTFFCERVHRRLRKQKT